MTLIGPLLMNTIMAILPLLTMEIIVPIRFIPKLCGYMGEIKPDLGPNTAFLFSYFVKKT